jgi:hypothetical protein
MQREAPQEVTLARVFARHYELHGKKLRSAEAVRYSLLRWNEFFKDALVSEVTSQHQDEFVAFLRGQGLSDGYIRRIQADGKSAINRAHRDGELAAAPFIRRATRASAWQASRRLPSSGGMPCMIGSAPTSCSPSAR